jgi:hypothetical protein
MPHAHRRRRSGRGRGSQAVCVPGRNGKDFTFLMRDPISAEALQLLNRLPVLFVIGALRCWSERRSALHPFCTASSGTTTPTNAMSTSAGLNAVGIIYFDCLLFYILSTYSHTMLDQILS